MFCVDTRLRYPIITKGSYYDHDKNVHLLIMAVETLCLQKECEKVTIDNRSLCALAVDPKSQLKSTFPLSPCLLFSLCARSFSSLRRARCSRAIRAFSFSLTARSSSSFWRISVSRRCSSAALASSSSWACRL